MIRHKEIELVRSHLVLQDSEITILGNDIGPQYRSAIYCSNEEELEMAKKTKELFQQELIKNGTKKAITTEIKIETEFFYAEGKSHSRVILEFLFL